MRELTNVKISEGYKGILHRHTVTGAVMSDSAWFTGDGVFAGGSDKITCSREDTFNSFLNDFPKDPDSTRTMPFGLNQSSAVVSESYPSLGVMSTTSPVTNPYVLQRFVFGSLGSIDHIINSTNGFTGNVAAYTQIKNGHSMSGSDYKYSSFNIGPVKNTDAGAGLILDARYCSDSTSYPAYINIGAGLFKDKGYADKSAGLMYYFKYGGTESFMSNTDNSTTLGTAGLRWKEIFAATATVNTSDERLKTFKAIEQREIDCAKDLKGMIAKFQFNDSIEEKGADKARLHFGVGAQSVIAKMEEHGLEPMSYSFICYDEWEATPEELDENGNVVKEATPAGNRYGIRYEELLCFIMIGL